MSFQVPAYLAQRQTSLAEDLTQGLGGQRPPSLSIKSQNFTLIDAAGNEKAAGLFDQQTRQFYIDVIIVDGNRAVSKTFYDRPYDPQADDSGPPACFSDNGIGPSSQAQTPQSTTCAACPHAAWGSKINAQTGAQSKACNDAKKVAVIVPGQERLDMPFLLRIPPNTLNKFWAPYLRTLSGTMVGNRPVDVADVVTRITFDPTTQGTLNFQAVRFVSEEEFHAIVALQATDKTAQLVGKMDKVFAGQLPAPAAAPAIAAPLTPTGVAQLGAQAPFAQPAAARAAPIASPSFQQPSGIFPPASHPSGGATTASPSNPPQQPLFQSQQGQQPIFGTPAPFPPQPVPQGLVPPAAIPQQEAPRQRVRRTKAEMQAQQGQQSTPQAPPEIIPPQQPAPMFQQPQAPQPPAQQHGMIQNAPPPPADMASALAAALNLPTGG